MGAEARGAVGRGEEYSRPERHESFGRPAATPVHSARHCREAASLRLHGNAARYAQALLLAARKTHAALAENILHLVPQRRALQRPFHALVHRALAQLLMQ